MNKIKCPDTDLRKYGQLVLDNRQFGLVSGDRRGQWDDCQNGVSSADFLLLGFTYPVICAVGGSDVTLLDKEHSLVCILKQMGS